MWTPSDSVMPKLFVTQRNRFLITYTGPKIKVHISPQEIHVWGKSGKFSNGGSINAFEFYVEPTLNKHFSLRIGRQALSLDNGRLFSAAPWGQQSRAHEGVRLFYKNSIATDFTFAFTRPYGDRFDAAYSPVASHQYKYLAVHHLKVRLNSYFDLTTINAMDVFKIAGEKGKYHERFTSGGRLEYTNRPFYATINSYYQFGKNSGPKSIRAYYIQPEISVNVEKTILKLGAEILSGNRETIPANLTNSFVPLYGVAWKFMGNMNLFTKFPTDVNDKGLINPYLFAIYQISKKLSVRADAHLFYSQYQLQESGQNLAGKYLGFENDISLNFKPVNRVEIIYGLSYTFAEKRMEALHKVPDAGKVPVWSYLMISYIPRLLHKEKRFLR